MSHTTFSKLFYSLLLIWGIWLITPQISTARHRCPKPPPIKFSLFSIQAFVASSVASTIATGRTFNTSGCDRGHPSDSFYRPKGAIYLQKLLEQVVEESSQGQGKHLDALASLAGCSSAAFPLFSQTLQKHYNVLFTPFSHLSLKNQADRIWDKLENIVTHDASLHAVCPMAS
ncbi:MAG: DUF3015 family protein [SAR324 cluster bacterium]|nr:DUF3015 family protein [SAR324 cluster bacterium]